MPKMGTSTLRMIEIRINSKRLHTSSTGFVMIHENGTVETLPFGYFGK